MGTPHPVARQPHGARAVDMGQESTCSTGADGKLELRVFDTAQSGEPFHFGISIDDDDCDSG